MAGHDAMTVAEKAKQFVYGFVGITLILGGCGCGFLFVGWLAVNYLSPVYASAIIFFGGCAALTGLMMRDTHWGTQDYPPRSGSSADRASASEAEGRAFDPRPEHQPTTPRG